MSSGFCLIGRAGVHDGWLARGHYTYIFFTCLPPNILFLMGAYVSSRRACVFIGRQKDGYQGWPVVWLVRGRGLDEKMVAVREKRTWVG